MRRQGSSCMLLPKCDVDDASKNRSVTLLNREDLPSYSCERFYLLSELQQRAYSSVFLSDFRNEDNATQETTSTAPDDDSAASEVLGEELAPYALLYLFWKPEMTNDTTEFIEQHLLPQVLQLQSMRTIVNSMPSLDRPNSIISRTIGSTKDSTDENDATTNTKGERQNNGNEGRRTISIYIVVDRLAAVSSESLNDPIESIRQLEQQYQQEQAAIEDLARKVAKHEQLRDLCEGITVGLSNHERCAPGLEACADAVALGAKERRTALASIKLSTVTDKDEGRSLLGIATTEPNDLLGLQSESATDAAQGVMQMRLSTEWNGQGNIKSFAERAQSCWRQQHGLADFSKKVVSSPRKVISRKRRLPVAVTSAEMKEYLFNGVALLLICGYLVFHLRNDLQVVVSYLDPSNWDNWIQRLRSL